MKGFITGLVSAVLGVKLNNQFKPRCNTDICDLNESICSFDSLPDCCLFDESSFFVDPTPHDCITKVNCPNGASIHNQIDFYKIDDCDFSYDTAPYNLIRFSGKGDDLPSIQGCDFGTGLNADDNGCDYPVGEVSFPDYIQLLDCSPCTEIDPDSCIYPYVDNKY